MEPEASLGARSLDVGPSLLHAGHAPDVGSLVVTTDMDVLDILYKSLFLDTGGHPFQSFVGLNLLRLLIPWVLIDINLSQVSVFGVVVKDLGIHILSIPRRYELTGITFGAHLECLIIKLHCSL